MCHQVRVSSLVSPTYIVQPQQSFLFLYLSHLAVNLRQKFFGANMIKKRKEFFGANMIKKRKEFIGARPKQYDLKTSLYLIKL